MHFGTDGDLKLYHNGSNAHIKNATGNFTIDNTSGDLVLQAKAGENSVYCVADAAVNLYYNNGKTLETTANGVTIYDDGKDDEARLIVQGGEGNAASMYLYADDGDDYADKWRVYSTASGAFGIESYSTGSWVSGLSFDGSVNATFGGVMTINGSTSLTGELSLIHI